MKPTSQVAGLTAALFILTLAMGLSFGSSGAGGGGEQNSYTSVPSNNSNPSFSPRIILVAQGINPSYLYQSSLHSSIPQYMLEPLAGVRLSLTSLNREILSLHGRVPAIVVRTNSSGIAFVVVAAGNYSVTIGGPNFNINTTMSFMENSTNTIRLNLTSSGYAVESLHLVSPDSASGVEPTTKINALLQNETAPAPGFAELVGYRFLVPFNGTLPIFVMSQVALNATVLGSYPGTQGTWVVLAPTGTYSEYPVAGVLLFQFRPVFEVTSTFG